MKTGMHASIRLFIERNLFADDPMPERSWLDQKARRSTPSHSGRRGSLHGKGQ